MTAQLTHEATQAPAPEGTQATPAAPEAPAGGGRFRKGWHRIRATVQEMNYAAGRVVDLPGTLDR